MSGYSFHFTDGETETEMSYHFLKIPHTTKDRTEA